MLNWSDLIISQTQTEKIDMLAAGPVLTLKESQQVQKVRLESAKSIGALVRLFWNKDTSDH